MASIIKTVLALENGIIPPNADFRSPHPDIKAEERNMKVVYQPLLSMSIHLINSNSFPMKQSLGHVTEFEEPQSILSAMVALMVGAIGLAICRYER